MNYRATHCFLGSQHLTATSDEDLRTSTAIQLNSSTRLQWSRVRPTNWNRWQTQPRSENSEQQTAALYKTWGNNSCIERRRFILTVSSKRSQCGVTEFDPRHRVMLINARARTMLVGWASKLHPQSTSNTNGSVSPFAKTSSLWYGKLSQRLSSSASDVSDVFCRICRLSQLPWMPPRLSSSASDVSDVFCRICRLSQLPWMPPKAVATWSLSTNPQYFSVTGHHCW